MPLLQLLADVRAETDLPLVAAGGLMDAADVAAALAAGATWAGLGTAFLGCPEAGTHPTHLAALTDPRFDRTAMTRAFTGRPARALVNAFVREHDAGGAARLPGGAPRHPAAAHRGSRRRRRRTTCTCGPGEGWQRLRPMPAADLVRSLAPGGRSSAELV